MDNRVKELTEKLESGFWFIRSWAAKELGKTGDSAAIQPLINALTDKKEVVRAAQQKHWG